MYNYLSAHKKGDDKVGGVCGYMRIRQEMKTFQEETEEERDMDCLTSFVNYFVDIQKVQVAEYHYAHLIDKAFESVSGFIHVLPGAFSAYNMESLIDY